MAGLKMPSRRFLGLLVAILLAGVATLALMAYMRGVEARAALEAEPVEVYVATDTIPLGTTANDAISQNLIERDTVPRRNLPSGALGSLEDIDGLVANAAIGPGEELVGSRWVPVTQLADELDIPEGLHAVAVEVGVPQGVAGYVTPGDRIGVIAHLGGDDAASGEEGAAPAGTARFVLQGVEVLAVGQRQPGQSQGSAADPGGLDGVTGAAVAQQDEPQTTMLVTVAADAEDAERLVLARLEGDVYFTLMPDGTEPTATSGRTPDNLFE